MAVSRFTVDEFRRSRRSHLPETRMMARETEHRAPHDAEEWSLVNVKAQALAPVLADLVAQHEPVKGKDSE